MDAYDFMTHNQYEGRKLGYGAQAEGEDALPKKRRRQRDVWTDKNGKRGEPMAAAQQAVGNGARMWYPPAYMRDLESSEATPLPTQDGGDAC